MFVVLEVLVAMVVFMAVVVGLLVVVGMSVVVIPKETAGTLIKSFAIQPIKENIWKIIFPFPLVIWIKQNWQNFLNWLDRKKPTRKPFSLCSSQMQKKQATIIWNFPQKRKLIFPHSSSVSELFPLVSITTIKLGIVKIGHNKCVIIGSTSQSKWCLSLLTCNDFYRERRCAGFTICGINYGHLEQRLCTCMCHTGLFLYNR